MPLEFFLTILIIEFVVIVKVHTYEVINESYKHDNAYICKIQKGHLDAGK